MATRASPTASAGTTTRVENVVLAQTGAVADDAAVVIVAGPKADFLPAEIDALKKYLDKSGKLLLEIDPPEKPDSAPLTNLIALAHDWGIDIGNDIVVDASGMGQLVGTGRFRAARRQLSVARHHAAAEAHHRLSARAIRDRGRGRRQRPHGAGFRRDEPAQLGGIRHQGPAGVGKVSMDPASGDKPGPITIAAAVSAAAPRAATTEAGPRPTHRSPKRESSCSAIRISWRTRHPAALPGNRDLFMNALGWLSQQENLISIRPQRAPDRRVTLTGGRSTRSSCCRCS